MNIRPVIVTLLLLVGQMAYPATKSPYEACYAMLEAAAATPHSSAEDFTIELNKIFLVSKRLPKAWAPLFFEGLALRSGGLGYASNSEMIIKDYRRNLLTNPFAVGASTRRLRAVERQIVNPGSSYVRSLMILYGAKSISEFLNSLNLSTGPYAQHSHNFDIMELALNAEEFPRAIGHLSHGTIADALVFKQGLRKFTLDRPELANFVGPMRDFIKEDNNAVVTWTDRFYFVDPILGVPVLLVSVALSNPPTL